MADPALVVCGHGTRDPRGRAAIAAVVDEVRGMLPGVAVHEAYVDVHGPEVGDVVAALPRAADGGRSGVVVPLLLAAGYHVRVDLAEAVRERPDVVVTGALGPDDRLVDVVLDRLSEASVLQGASVVLAPAGSSDERSQAASRETARRLGQRSGAPVRVGYAAGPRPPVACAVTAARIDGAAAVVVASYLLAPGFFQRRLEGCGADVVTGPLLPDPRVAEIVLDRYRAAVR
ncbi:sirohydrochlorin chelatase [Phycicoccus sp. BSK3Z-2]|uniref:Sirohydrochlorin chelatase n=1 Tax=Phycicoccus avicenniae TaxID=2828860 RepID=A0A941I1N3_9MICO|nr:sirohydrochlorin chelatase [Phycicoccus avicenniae]MBR7744486.1 sirohydrochlorin chelatase [Phycicoccus avicenniae]